MWTEEDKNITGHNSLEEWKAYDKGRDDEECVIWNWIKNWDGRRNSAMGNLLYLKMKELFTIVGGQWVRTDNQPMNTELIISYDNKEE